MKEAFKVHSKDMVAVALMPLTAGSRVDVGGEAVTLGQNIPSGHKFALVPIAPGEDVLRYGFPFGRASAAIAPGEHVHSHNVRTALGLGGDYRFGGGAVAEDAPASLLDRPRQFDGYRRDDGSVGTRNEIWVIPTVGCVGRTAERLAALASASLPDGVDGVLALPHPYGCSQLGDDLDGTRSLLAALACHPNAGGVLLIGLGCESNQLAALLDLIPQERRARIRTMGAQASADEIEEGLAAIAELATIAAQDKREPVPLSALRLGVKCGGSDGLSGMTANPLIGRMADSVGEAGGSVVLTEIPEIFGAEQLLMDRCADRDTFDALVALVHRFKQYFVDHGEPVSENPSPGNIAGGITKVLKGDGKSVGSIILWTYVLGDFTN